MTSGSMYCEMCGSFGCAGSYVADIDTSFLLNLCHEVLRRDFQERKSVSRHRLTLSSYLISQATFRLSYYLTPDPSMSTPQNTEYMDARGATFNNVCRDQINADQVIINPNSIGAMPNHSCTIIYSFSVIPDSRSQGIAKASTRRRI